MEQPVFILSTPRSYTTVTCAMLGNHPQMFGLAETKLFTAETIGGLSQLFQLQVRLRHGLLRSIAELGFAEQSEETVAAAKAWLADNDDMSTIEMFGLLAAWAGERSLIEKSPAHIYKLEFMQRMQRGFPEAFYLHLTRHPVAMYVSMREMQNKIDNLKKRASQFSKSNRKNITEINKELEPDTIWLSPHLNVVEFLKGVPENNQLRIRGEDLLENPQKHLAHICEWLGKRDDGEAIEAMMHPEQSPFAHYGPRNARFGNDPKFMESPELRPYKSKPMPLDDVEIGGQIVKLSAKLIDTAKSFGY